jgi:hypothetical protein
MRMCECEKINLLMAHRFSRKVFAFVMFFPIALAFHAQKEPDGSTW